MGKFKRGNLFNLCILTINNDQSFSLTFLLRCLLPQTRQGNYGKVLYITSAHGPYLWIYIRTEKGRMMVLHKTDIGSSKVYLVFLVSTKIWNAVFFKQLVIILLCQTLFPKKRKRKLNSRNGKTLDVSVCITITVMLKYQTTYHVLSGLSSSFQMNLSRKW